MATKRPNPFAGKESKREERMEKKLPPAAYKRGERMEKAGGMMKHSGRGKKGC
jgi:hypothetical protein